MSDKTFKPWEMYKKAFFQWESSTAELLDRILRNPLVLGPSGAMLSMMMKGKAASDRMAAQWWENLGLPTRTDQERMMHALNQLQSQLYDLEEELAELRERRD